MSSGHLTAEKIRARLKHPVIDADGHVYEGNVDLRPRMPEKWRSQAPINLKDNEGNSRILLEGRMWSASQGLGPGVSAPMTDKARGFRQGMVDPVARFHLGNGAMLPLYGLAVVGAGKGDAALFTATTVVVAQAVL